MKSTAITFAALTAGLLGMLSAGFLLSPLRAQSDSYVLEEIPVPKGERFEVGGLGFLSDGRMVVSTRRGQVWIVEGALKDPKAAKFHLFAEGLHDCLGLEIVDDVIYIVQRAELSRLIDTDGDGCCDRVECVSHQWGVSGNYHEFAFGLPRDNEGNFYVSLNVSFFSPKWWHGKSPVPYRGWVLKIAPDGTTTPVASGFRSPCGVARNTAGDIFITDNQGDWLPVCPIMHLQQGRFYGHPASLDWTKASLAFGTKSTNTDPPQQKRAAAAVWIPYKWSRSTGNLVSDRTQGKFGPFADQLFVAELTNGYLLRAQLEKVRGEYQGAVFPFQKNVGSAVRTCFAPDGSLIIGRTERGWGGQPPGDGLARLRYTGVKPFEIAAVNLKSDGFALSFTKPLSEGIKLDAKQLHIISYDYNYWWEYGSPEQRIKTHHAQSLRLSEDRKTLRVVMPLQAGRCVRMKLSGFMANDGSTLSNNEFAYTINQLIDGPLFEGHVAKLVEKPRPRENSNEDFLMLADGAALDSFKDTKGWRLGDVVLNKKSPERFDFKDEPKPEDDISNKVLDVTNAGQESCANLESKVEMGDVNMTVWFLLPKGGSTKIYLQGRYGLILTSDKATAAPGLADMGAILPSRNSAGTPADLATHKKTGQWQSVSMLFQAPRFDAQGKKVANARFKRVMVNDTLLHENVELFGPSLDAPYQDEVALGPIYLRGDMGEVAYRSVNFKQLSIARDPNPAPWQSIFDGKSLKDWRISDQGNWKVEAGTVVGRGPRSHLFSPRKDYRNFEFRARVKINDNGNSGMYFRVTFGEGWPQGYEAQINSTFKDPVKTGSLYNLALVRARLIPANTWFTQHIICREVKTGTHITIKLNGIKTVNYIDTSRLHKSGHIAFQQHHQGSEVRIKNIEIREL
ncbi:MAG: family 16 glycoside hydrolase [Planctomycetota bacterium]